MDAKQKISHRGTWIEVIVSSLIGLIAALVLATDAVAIAKNADVILSCNINEFISCGRVAASWQASLLGFPNAFLGLIAEPIILTIAVASLARVKFPRWFMLAAQAVSAIGFAFAYWLFTQSYFVIGSLCPWCLTVTVTTTLIFLAFTRINILDGNFGDKATRVASKALEEYRIDLVIAILSVAIIAAMIIVKYL
jgi:uncharacterized membrane protein